MAKVYNVGGGGGSKKDLVTLNGGGEITMDSSLGSAPYAIGVDENGITVNGKSVAKVGADGAPGKSAYETAVEGGFLGTEEELSAQLAGGPYLPLSGGTMTGDISLGSNTILSVKGVQFNPQTSYQGSGGTIAFMKGGQYVLYNGSKLAPIQVGEPTKEDNAVTLKYLNTTIQSAILDSWNASY